MAKSIQIDLWNPVVVKFFPRWKTLKSHCCTVYPYLSNASNISSFLQLASSHVKSSVYIILYNLTKNQFKEWFNFTISYFPYNWGLTTLSSGRFTPVETVTFRHYYKEEVLLHVIYLMNGSWCLCSHNETRITTWFISWLETMHLLRIACVLDCCRFCFILVLSPEDISSSKRSYSNICKAPIF